MKVTLELTSCRTASTHIHGILAKIFDIQKARKFISQLCGIIRKRTDCLEETGLATHFDQY